MAFDAIADLDIGEDKALDTALATKLKSRDDWNKSDAIASADHFTDGYTGHSHDGTPGEGANIVEAGIAANAINLAAHVPPNAVTTAKMKANTFQSGDFVNAAVTTSKMSGKVGTNKTGSVAGAATVTISGIGHRAVVTNKIGSHYCVQATTNNAIILRYDTLVGPPPNPWTYDIHYV